MSKERIQFRIYGLRTSISMEDWKNLKRRFDIRYAGITFIPVDTMPQYSILQECSLCRRYRKFDYNSFLNLEQHSRTIEQHCGRCPFSKFRQLSDLPEEAKKQFPGCTVLMSKILGISLIMPFKFSPQISIIHYEMNDKVAAEAQLKKIYDKMEEIEARRKL